MTENSTITVWKGSAGVTFAGPDAVELFRASALRVALELLAVGIIPAKGLTKRKALAMASKYTGRTYKEVPEARADLKVWIETMKSAIPTEVR
jgi:hypothetical protein